MKKYSATHVWFGQDMTYVFLCSKICTQRTSQKRQKDIHTKHATQVHIHGALSAHWRDLWCRLLRLFGEPLNYLVNVGHFQGRARDYNPRIIADIIQVQLCQKLSVEKQLCMDVCKTHTSDEFCFRRVRFNVNLVRQDQQWSGCKFPVWLCVSTLNQCSQSRTRNTNLSSKS